MATLILALGLWLLVVSLASFFVVRNLPLEVEAAVAKAAQAEAVAQPISDEEFIQRLETIVKSYARKKVSEQKSVKKVDGKSATARKMSMLQNLLSLEQAFYFYNPVNGEGAFARNLHEFLETVRNLPQEVIDFHMREDVNDFEDWMRSVIKDVKLAEELKRIKEDSGANKEEIIRALEKRLEAQKKLLVKNPIKGPKPGYL